MKKLFCLLAPMTLALYILLSVIYVNEEFLIERNILITVMILLTIIGMVICCKWEKTGKAYAVFAIEIFILIWELNTSILNILNPILFPTPEKVIRVFGVEHKYLTTCALSSLKLILTGYLYALPLGTILGVIVGWKKQLNEFFVPITKVLSSIPPIIYAPYIISMAPSFRAASILVISIAMFWPIFMNMVNRIEKIDSEIMNSVKPLGLSAASVVWNILIPYAVPAVVTGIKTSFSSSFVMLIFAEMMGTSAGLGYFIKLYSDYANYANVVAGIILVGALVIFLNKIFNTLENVIVKW